MSAEGSSFGFNSLIPQTYKSKAEAFAKCLQDKLMLLGGYNDGGDTLTNGKSKRLNSESDVNGTANKKPDDDFPFDIADNIFVQHPGEKYREPKIENKYAELPKYNGQYKYIKGKKGYSSDSEDSDTEDEKFKTDNFVQDLQKFNADETENYRNGSETSDLVLNSHKQSELLHKRVHELMNNGSNEKPQELRKLQSVSSEESTVDSWCSCDDHDVYDSDEKEEINYFASQIKGSPKLKSAKLRNRRRWNNNKGEDDSWKKLPVVNYSPVSGPDVFSDFDTECFSPVEDPEESEQLINVNENEQELGGENVVFLDGLDMENYDVPYRILRESSSANNLEKHFSQKGSDMDPIIIEDSYLRNKELFNVNSSPTNLKPPSPDYYSQLLTPPPSPEYPREENSTSPAAGDYVVNVKELEDGEELKEEEEEEVKEDEVIKQETDQSVLIEETSNQEEENTDRNFETEERVSTPKENESPELVGEETAEKTAVERLTELNVNKEQHLESEQQPQPQQQQQPMQLQQLEELQQLEQLQQSEDLQQLEQQSEQLQQLEQQLQELQQPEQQLEHVQLLEQQSEQLQQLEQQSEQLQQLEQQSEQLQQLEQQLQQLQQPEQQPEHVQLLKQRSEQLLQQQQQELMTQQQPNEKSNETDIKTTVNEVMQSADIVTGPIQQQADDEPHETDVKTETNEKMNFADIITDPILQTDEAQELVPEPVPTNFTSTFSKKGGMIVECPCDNFKLDLCCGLELPTLDCCPNSEESQTTCSIQVQIDEADNSKTETKFTVESIDESSLEKPCQPVVENGLTIPGSKNDDDDEEGEMLSPRLKLRRCSSLKTWKTPPGTPGRKKIVRFADALGLDLADVRTFLDEIPKIPSSAYEDLNFDLNADSFLSCPCPAPPPTMPTLIPSFAQPGGQIDFLERVKNNSVLLESAVLTDTTVFTISGTIRVLNLDYNKSVHVRYTLDNWLTFSDLQATYVPNSCDGFSDKFSFVLYGHTLKIGQSLEFAIRLECQGRHYWDNNAGNNYIFQCLPQSPSTAIFTPLSISPESTWTNKFY